MSGTGATAAERALSIRYAVLVAASVTPLLVVVALLALFQIAGQREVELEGIRRSVVEHRSGIGAVVEAARGHVGQMRTFAEDYLRNFVPERRAPLRDKLARWTGRPAGERGAAVVLRADPAEGDPRVGTVMAGETALEPERLADGDVDLGLDLFPLMRAAHAAYPYLHWSYFFSVREDFIAFYPRAEEAELLATAGLDDLRAVLAGWFAYDVFVAATPPRNPGHPYWTGAYADAGGAGLMVSHAAPVHARGAFAGMVGTDVLLSHLEAVTRRFAVPQGRLWIVNDRGQALSATGIAPDAPPAIRTLAETLPDPLRAAPTADLLAADGVFRALAGHHVMALPIAGAPWTLLYAVSDAEIDALLRPRLAPYAVILVGLVATALLTHALLRWQFVRPALALVRYIRAAAAGDDPRHPRLPAVWRPWLDVLAATFRAKHAQVEELRLSEERLRALAQAVPVPIAITARDDGRVLFANARCRAVFGLSPDDPAGRRSVDTYVDPDARARLLAEVAAGRPVDGAEVVLKRADGRAFWALISLQPMVYDGTPAVLSGIVDIDALKESERSLRDSRALKSAIIDHALDGIVSIDEAGRIIDFNPAAERMLGYTRAEALGRFMHALMVPPEQRAAHLAGFARHVVTGERRLIGRRIESTALRADGSEFPCELAISAVEQSSRRIFTAYIRDLTEVRHAEAEIARQRDALHQTEKMTALGSLLAGVAHELNNPLSVLVGHAHLLGETAEDPQVRGRAERIRAAAERCARIVRTFLAMARQKPPERGPVALGDLVRNALEIVAYGLRSAGVQVSTDVPDDLPPLYADGDQLHQVLMNLFINAQHAMEGMDGPRRLDVTARPSADGGCITIEVADTGPGLPPALRARVFEPFFTTKPQGVGTGLGLSICHGVVAAHGGRIEIDDRPGGGAVFRLVLPVARGEAAEPPPPEARPARAAAARILVVDDEPDVAGLMAETLTLDGHRIDVAGSGREALERLETERYDLLLSDLRMPDLDGAALFRHLRDRDPAMLGRLVLLTGDILRGGLAAEALDAGIPVVEKPFEPTRLRAVVAERLEAANTPPRHT